MKLYPAWRQVEADLMARGMKDGETIPMDLLRAGFGVEDPRTMTDGIEVLRQQALFNFSLGELKASLLENHRIQLRLVEGVGYMVVPPSEQTRLTMKDRGSEIMNALTKAEREVTYIREDELTDEQRKENADARARMGQLRSLVRKRVFRLPL
jgi:hypothetical protein